MIKSANYQYLPCNKLIHLFNTDAFNQSKVTDINNVTKDFSDTLD